MEHSQPAGLVVIVYRVEAVTIEDYHHVAGMAGGDGVKVDLLDVAGRPLVSDVRDSTLLVGEHVEVVNTVAAGVERAGGAGLRRGRPEHRPR